MKAYKTLACIFTVLILVFSATPGISSTVYFAVDNTLNFNLLDGFDLFTTLSSADNLAATLSVKYVSAGGAVPDFVFIPPSTIAYWDIYNTSYGVNALREDAANLVPGVVLSLTSASTFNIADIDLLSYAHGSGFYQPAYQIIQTAYLDGTLYTATAVPIPAALWLLGSGLLGLAAIRRRRTR